MSIIENCGIMEINFNEVKFMNLETFLDIINCIAGLAATIKENEALDFERVELYEFMPMVVFPVFDKPIIAYWGKSPEPDSLAIKNSYARMETRYTIIDGNIRYISLGIAKEAKKVAWYVE